MLDMEDRSTCVLFGDGAGAAVIRREEDWTWHTVFGTRGGAEHIRTEGPGPDKAAIFMDGKPVFRFAVEVVEQSIHQLLQAEGCELTTWTGSSATRPTPGLWITWPRS